MVFWGKSEGALICQQSEKYTFSQRLSSKVVTRVWGHGRCEQRKQIVFSQIASFQSLFIYILTVSERKPEMSLVCTTTEQLVSLGCIKFQVRRLFIFNMTSPGRKFAIPNVCFQQQSRNGKCQRKGFSLYWTSLAQFPRCLATCLHISFSPLQIYTQMVSVTV